MSYVHVTRHLAAYVEGALAPEVQARVAYHLERCSRCAGRHETVRRSVSAVAAALTATPLPEMAAARIRRAMRSSGTRDAGRASRRDAGAGISVAVAAAVLVFVVVAALLLQQPAGPVRLLTTDQADLPFETLARQAHAALSADDATLELVSTSPREVRDWVEARTAVRLSLVSDRLHPETRGGVPGGYRVLGATRLTGPGNIPVAAVLYEIDGRRTTLLATHQSHVPGAPRWSTGRKRVLYRAADGVSQLTWTNSGNAYSLVTELPDAGRKACGICHREVPRLTGPVPDA